MQYLCEKQLTAGGVTYYPGEIIPESVIYPERSGKLSKNGFISEFRADNGDIPEGIAEGFNPLVATVPVTILGADQSEVITMTADDVALALVIVQMSAAEAAKAAKDVKSDNVATLLKAIDNRKSVLAALGTVVKDDGTDGAESKT